MTADGQRIGAGDVIVTRRNDPTLGVANRETWMVTRVHRDGRLTVNATDRGGRELTADYVREYLQLGYATTGYGVQGDTTEAAHLVMTDTTTAAAAYVAMTRGRQANTAHLVAEDLDDAREQWITAFSRERADLGPSRRTRRGGPRRGRIRSCLAAGRPRPARRRAGRAAPGVGRAAGRPPPAAVPAAAAGPCSGAGRLVGPLPAGPGPTRGRP